MTGRWPPRWLRRRAANPAPGEVLGAVGGGELKAMSFRFAPGDGPGADVPWPAEAMGGFGVPSSRGGDPRAGLAGAGGLGGGRVPLPAELVATLRGDAAAEHAAADHGVLAALWQRHSGCDPASCGDRAILEGSADSS